MICQSIFVSAFKPSNLVKRLASCPTKSTNLFVNAGKIPTNRILLAKTHNASFPLVQWSRSIHGSHSLEKMLQNPEMVPPPEPTSENDVRERVLKAIKAWDRFPQDRADKLTLEARMSEDLSFDSLDMVEIVMSLEDEFGIEIKQEDAETFKTPNDAADFIIKFTGISDTEEF